MQFEQASPSTGSTGACAQKDCAHWAAHAAGVQTHVRSAWSKA
jgi:hypothetical protein